MFRIEWLSSSSTNVLCHRDLTTHLGNALRDFQIQYSLQTPGFSLTVPCGFPRRDAQWYYFSKEVIGEKCFFFQVHILAHLNMQTHCRPSVEVCIHREPTFRTQPDFTIESAHAFGLHNMQLPSTWLNWITNCCWFSSWSLLNSLVCIFSLVFPWFIHDIFMYIKGRLLKFKLQCQISSWKIHSYDVQMIL